MDDGLWMVLLLTLAPSCGGRAESNEPEAPPSVGDVCISELEDEGAFTGFTASEVLVETASAACATGVCVVHGFQGRVSCPYGQSAASDGCVTPFGAEPVSVAVQPQLVERPPSIGSVCSCPCDGAGAGPYCTCPSTMVCVDFVGATAVDLNLDSYCVPRGSLNFRAVGGGVCEAGAANCEDRVP